MKYFKKQFLENVTFELKQVWHGESPQFILSDKLHNLFETAFFSKYFGTLLVFTLTGKLWEREQEDNTTKGNTGQI